MKPYVHGYSPKETRRLADQANTLTRLLHHDTRYPDGALILEAGCGIGAQTVILAANNPGARFVSIDLSRDSLETARTALEMRGIANVVLQQADIFSLPFDPGSFDHIFVCFVLEHLPEPMKALIHLKQVLKKGGTITLIEGDHGSFYCHPQTREASLAVQCLVDVQAAMGGNSLIGRQLYPLLCRAGFSSPVVSPRMVYVDSSRPFLVEGFSKKTFIAMVRGVKDQAMAMGLIDKETWDRGMADLDEATREHGTFCYTFFKGVAVNS
ncbi:MAG: methyltransferase domain-containing protein [Pseudomonadota bacterium]